MSDKPIIDLQSDEHFMRDGMHHGAEGAAGQGEPAKHHQEQNDYSGCCKHV